MAWILPIIIAYLLGAIPFGLLVPRAFGVKDIRQHGSGNIGATNATRVLGFRRAVWVFVGDIAKGVVAVLVARWYGSQYPIPFEAVHPYLVICALAAVVGHVFPIYLRFKGGKGVNTALGVMLALLPVEALLAFGVFAVVFVIGRYVSVASMTAAVALLGILLVERFAMGREVAPVYIWVTAVLVVLIVYAHRGNIRRLAAGTENKFERRTPAGKDRAGSHV